MSFRLRTLALAAALLAAGQAQAAPVATFYASSDNARAALGTATERAVAQARIGNANTTGDDEVGLHTPPNVTDAGPIGTAGQMEWGNSLDYPFTLTRRGNALRFVLAGCDETYTDSGVGRIDAFIIRARAVALSALSVTSLVLDDATPGTLTPGDILQGAGASGLPITGITGDFTLTGFVGMTWVVTRPNRSSIAFQIKAFDTSNENGGDPALLPTPAGLGLSGLGLLALAGFRRRG